jgi:hypothetical protein
VSATKSDDRVSGVKIMTTSSLFCTVVLGFGSDNRSTTVSVSALNPVTVSGADRWRCTTVGNMGADCTRNGMFDALIPEIVAHQANTTVTYAGSDDVGTHMTDLKLPDFPGLFNVSTITDTVVMIIVIIAVLLVVCLIIALVVRHCKKKKEVPEDWQASP